MLGSSTMPRAVMGKYAVVRFNQWPEGVQFGWMCGIVPVGGTGSPIGVAAPPADGKTARRKHDMDENTQERYVEMLAAVAQCIDEVWQAAERAYTQHTGRRRW